MSLISDTIGLDREIARTLRGYIGLVWHQVEPAREYMSNYHIDAICDHLEAVTRHEITRLVINVPPGTSKSITCGVMWPSWSWTTDASTKWITGSYSGLISRRDALKARQLMESEFYQARWGHLWNKNPDDWSSICYRNSEAGFRLAVTVAGSVTGEHADHQLVDDPIKPLDARGSRVDSAKLSACIDWWDETMTSRVVDAEKSTRTIIMQRLHDRDLAGHALDSGDYTHLNLPMRYEPRCVITVPHCCTLKADARGEETPPTPLNYKDHRQEGELLWPARFPESIQARRKKELGSRGVAAQDQQRPVPSGGGIFKREWIQHWREFPKGRVQYIQSWDCAFKGLADSDYVVGQVWASYRGEYWLVDQVRDQMSVSATCRAILALSAKWPRAVRKLIEDKANGPAVIQLMKKEIPGLIEVNPKGGKIARAQAVEPIWESGNVWIPDPRLSRWVHDFIEELVSFNGDPGRPDDQVDSMTQALVNLHAGTVSQYREAMRRIA